MYGHHVPLGLGKEPTACKERLNDKGKVDTSEECPQQPRLHPRLYRGLGSSIVVQLVAQRFSYQHRGLVTSIEVQLLAQRFRAPPIAAATSPTSVFPAVIRQHTSAYVSIRQHTSAYIRAVGLDGWQPRVDSHLYRGLVEGELVAQRFGRCLYFRVLVISEVKTLPEIQVYSIRTHMQWYAIYLYFQQLLVHGGVRKATPRGLLSSSKEFQRGLVSSIEKPVFPAASCAQRSSEGASKDYMYYCFTTAALLLLYYCFRRLHGFAVPHANV